MRSMIAVNEVTNRPSRKVDATIELIHVFVDVVYFLAVYLCAFS